jgi:hypothetical protein
MIELVLAVCMISEPDQCKNVHLTFMAENMTPFHCMLYGQSEIAKWSEAHPDWKIQRWSCGRPSGVVKI